MVERDLGSTYLMPQSKLYKPDNRVSACASMVQSASSIGSLSSIKVHYTKFVLSLQGSDTSNFDSL